MKVAERLLPSVKQEDIFEVRSCGEKISGDVGYQEEQIGQRNPPAAARAHHRSKLAASQTRKTEIMSQSLQCTQTSIFGFFGEAGGTRKNDLIIEEPHH